jgi:hypothetical protein
MREHTYNREVDRKQYYTETVLYLQYGRGSRSSENAVCPFPQYLFRTTGYDPLHVYCTVQSASRQQHQQERIACPRRSSNYSRHPPPAVRSSRVFAGNQSWERIVPNQKTTGIRGYGPCSVSYLQRVHSSRRITLNLFVTLEGQPALCYSIHFTPCNCREGLRSL